MDLGFVTCYSTQIVEFAAKARFRSTRSCRAFGTSIMTTNTWGDPSISPAESEGVVIAKEPGNESE
jgi:hypothetical protein